MAANKPAAKAAAKKAAKKKPAGRLRWSDTPTVKAVRAELRALDERKPGIAASAIAAGAVAVAKRIDDPDTPAPAVASCLRSLEHAMSTLHAQAPEPKPDAPEQEDPLDRLAASIADRLAAS